MRSMETHYGHLVENWKVATEEMRDILIDCARERRTITYGELSAAIKTIQIPPNSYGMSGMLTEISKEDVKAGRKGVLATLVVRKSDGRPGPGYFRGALERGMSEDMLEAYWQEQFELTCADWGRL